LYINSLWSQRAICGELRKNSRKKNNNSELKNTKGGESGLWRGEKCVVIDGAVLIVFGEVLLSFYCCCFVEAFCIETIGQL